MGCTILRRCVNTAVTWLTPWTHGADFMDIYVRQDQPEGGTHLAAAEADLRGRRGGRGRRLRRPGRLGHGRARLVRGFGARLRERHRAELDRRGGPALLRVAGAVVLPGLVPVPRPGVAAGAAAVRNRRVEPVRRPDHSGVVAGSARRGSGERGRYRSTMIVTGPSLTRATFMSAPKTPVWTRAPRSRSACTTAPTRGSATGPGAAAHQDGRRPLAPSA